MRHPISSTMQSRRHSRRGHKFGQDMSPFVRLDSSIEVVLRPPLFVPIDIFKLSRFKWLSCLAIQQTWRACVDDKRARGGWPSGALAVGWKRGRKLCEGGTKKRLDRCELRESDYVLMVVSLLLSLNDCFWLVRFFVTVGIDTGTGIGGKIFVFTSAGGRGSGVMSS